MVRKGIRLPAFLVLVIVATAFLAACGRSGKGSLSAVVFVYDENRLVIPDAQIEINASSPELALNGKTGMAGTVTFTGLREDEFQTVAGLSPTGSQPEYKASKEKYITLSARVSGGDYVADNLKRGGRVHIEITLAQSEVDDPSWTPHRQFANADLHAIAFADSKRGWVAGSEGSVFYTADGGFSWTPQASGASATLTGLYLDRASEIWGVAPGAALVRATVGGAWTAVQSGEAAAAIQKLALSPDGTLWAIGPQGVLRSSDQGVTWNLALDPSTLGLGLIGLTDVVFRSASEGWVTGTAASGQTGVVLHTEDAGLTWSKLEATDCPLLAVAAVAPGNAWVTGCNVFRAEGEKLTAVPKMSKTFEYYDVAATGFGEAWVLARTAPATDVVQVGPAAAEVPLASVYHTEDGGDTWDVQYRSDTAVLNSLAITDDGRGWIVGDEGLLLSLERTSKLATPTPMPRYTPTPVP